MVSHIKPMTARAFETHALLPENRERRLEFHNGEIIEAVSNSKPSRIAARILSRLEQHVSENGLGYVTGADGGYVVAGNRYIPDAAFVSKVRQAEPPDVAYNPIAPDLAVEVISPTDDRDDLRIKVVNYLAVGTVVWVADPAKQHIEVYIPGQPEETFDQAGIIDGGDLLPGFKLAVKDIFAV